MKNQLFLSLSLYTALPQLGKITIEAAAVIYTS